jgi:hypothetical protein
MAKDEKKTSDTDAAASSDAFKQAVDAAVAEKTAALEAAFNASVEAKAREMNANASVGVYDPVAAEESAAAREAALKAELDAAQG